VKGRELSQTVRLEQALGRLRWLIVAFGAVQTAALWGDRTTHSRFAMPVATALVLGLAIGNVAVISAVRRSQSPEGLRKIGLFAFALDTTVLLGLIWVFANTPARPAWVIGYLLPIEGAVRYGLSGATLAALAFSTSEILREARFDHLLRRYLFDVPAVTFRVGMAFALAIVAGAFARSLQRETTHARERALLAEASARAAEQAAERERRARREVTAFHTAVLTGTAEDDAMLGMQLMAEAIGRELDCHALGLLLAETGEAGEPYLLAAGVHGDPGYLRGDRLPILSEPVGTAIQAGGPLLRRDPPDAVVPMRIRDEIVGAVHERGAVSGIVDAERLELLGRLADQIAVVVQSARLRERQEETMQRLRDLDEMKTDFVAITSHELRTPLSAIRGFVDMLRRRGTELSPEQSAEFLGIIALQTERLIKLVEDLLVVSRIEAGKLLFEPLEIGTDEILDQIIDGLGTDGGRVHRAVAPGAPATLVVDPQRLTQVLTNLLANALKFSSDSAPVDVVVTSPAEGIVTFSVTDRGPGIEPDERDRIFDRFHQTEHANNRNAEGFGLGLYITKQLVEAMGGWIRVRSELGEGSTFTVTIPASRVLSGPAPLSEAARSG
jgi:signal transduction histidine kinase